MLVETPPTLNPLKDFKNSHYIISIAIKHTGDGFFHAGIVHKDSDDKGAFLLDLPMHFALRSVALQQDFQTTDYYFVPHDIPERIQRQASAFFRNIYKRNNSEIPYGISFDGSTHFTENEAKFVIGEGFSGLTCATFVIAAFHAIQLYLLKIEQWPVEEIDPKWHAHIIQLMERHEAPPDHIEKVRAEKKCNRFLPTDVTAALTFVHDRRPVEYTEIKKKSKMIGIYLQES